MQKSNFQAYLLLGALAIIWGSSFILMKRALVSFNGFEVGALRMTFSFFLLLPLTFKYFKQVPSKYYLILFFVGLTGNGLPALLFAVAQTKINSSTAGILNSLTPIFTLLVGFIFIKLRFDVKKIIGVILGLVGAFVLILIRANGEFEVNYGYGLLIVLATLCYGISVNLVKNYLQHIGSLAISGFTLIGIGPPLMIWLLSSSNFWNKVATQPQALESITYVFLLGLFGTAVSLVLYNKLVKLTDALFASLVTYLMPIVSMFWGFLDGETFGIVHLIGIFLILGGIYISTKKNK